MTTVLKPKGLQRFLANATLPEPEFGGSQFGSKDPTLLIKTWQM
jgi:hypothetical protein